MCSVIYPFCLHTWETPFKSVYGSERNKSSKKVTRWGVYRTICHDNCTIYRKPIVKLYHQSKHIVNEQTIHVKIDIHLVYTSFSFVSHEIKKSFKKFYSLYIVNLISIFTKKNRLFPLYLMCCFRHIFQHIYFWWMYRLLYIQHSPVGFQYLPIKFFKKLKGS